MFFMFFRRHRKLVIFIVMLMIVLASYLAGSLVAESEPRIVAQADDEETAVQAGGNNDTITKDTVITWDYEYEMCGHDVYVDTEPDSDMIGLGFSQMKSAYPDVVIVSFASDKVVLKKRLGCYCPAHFMLKRNDDKLAVYRTAVGTDIQDIYIDIDIPFVDLNEEQKQMLEAGRVFSDLDDLRSFLEKIKQ